VSRSNVVSKIAHETFAHSLSIMPEGCWWENLESNFAQRPEGFELEPRDWLPGNHILHLDRGAYLEQILRFMREIEFLD